MQNNGATPTPMQEKANVSGTCRPLQRGKKTHVQEIHSFASTVFFSTT
jgi:acyl-coenzyme A thioesterase PaaI-like protein